MYECLSDASILTHLMRRKRKLALDTLPIEVLQLICNTLGTSYTPSVTSLSRINRQCRHAAASALFRRLRFYVESPEQLVEDTEPWTSILLTIDGFRHVQELTIQGDIYCNWRAHAHEQKPVASGRRLAPVQYDESFTPLARLLKQLPALKDLVFECESSFPSCLLLALHSDTLSACRLHVRNFKLRSLLRSTSNAMTAPLELAPNDLALATSPNLYAIVLAGNTRTAAGKADYHPEAVLELVAWGNPSLKEVEYRHKRVKNTPALRRSGDRKPYSGLKLPNKHHRNMSATGQLSSLSLDGSGPELARWQKSTNWDMLRTLRLRNTDASVVEWAVDLTKFPSLSTLELQTEPGETLSIPAKLLRSLPSLTDLTIISHLNDATLAGISDIYGTTLRRLSIPNFVCSVDDLRNLKHLSVRNARTGGDQSECELYKSLGAFSMLQSLHLTLDCSIDVGTESVCDQPSYDPGTRDVNYKQDFVRRSLVNCAADATLAAAIFRRIATASERPHSRLRCLELGVVRAGIIISHGQEYYSQQRTELYRHFSRRWICCPNPRDDRPEEVVFDETSNSRRLRERHADALGGKPPQLGGVEAAFRALWPKGTSRDWRDDWSSFSLQQV